MTFYLDIEVVQELKKIKNKSALVNNYLRHYFEIPQNIGKEELKAKVEEAHEIAAVFESKIEEIDKKEQDKPKYEEVYFT